MAAGAAFRVCRAKTKLAGGQNFNRVRPSQGRQRARKSSPKAVGDDASVQLSFLRDLVMNARPPARVLDGIEVGSTGNRG